jgi:hypothetical protein
MSKGFLGTYEAPVTVIFYEEDGSKKFWMRVFIDAN